MLASVLMALSVLSSPLRVPDYAQEDIYLLVRVEMSTEMVMIEPQSGGWVGYYNPAFFCKAKGDWLECKIPAQYIGIPGYRPTPYRVAACGAGGCGERVNEANMTCAANQGEGCPCWLFPSDDNQACWSK